jgi:hypothetical protein
MSLKSTVGHTAAFARGTRELVKVSPWSRRAIGHHRSNGLFMSSGSRPGDPEVRKAISGILQGIQEFARLANERKQRWLLSVSFPIVSTDSSECPIFLPGRWR